MYILVKWKQVLFTIEHGAVLNLSNDGNWNGFAEAWHALPRSAPLPYCDKSIRAKNCRLYSSYDAAEQAQRQWQQGGQQRPQQGGGDCCFRIISLRMEFSKNFLEEVPYWKNQATDALLQTGGRTMTRCTREHFPGFCKSIRSPAEVEKFLRIVSLKRLMIWCFQPLKWKHSYEYTVKTAGSQSLLKVNCNRQIEKT